MIYNELIKFFNENIINGIFISVLVIIIAKLFLKDRIDTFHSIKIIKWTVIVYVLLAIINVAFGMFSIENQALVNRATGPYWWAYCLMLITHLLLPLLLLHKKLGNKIYFILIITILMNIGWFFESFTIHITSLHQDYVSLDRNAFLPYDREIFIMLRGLFFGIIAIIGGIIIKYLKIHKILSKYKLQDLRGLKVFGVKDDKIKLEINENTSMEKIQEFLDSFPKHFQLSFFDNFYPSNTDPGAYVWLQRYDEEFAYVLSNHGWSSEWMKITGKEVLNLIDKNKKYTTDEFYIYLIRQQAVIGERY